MEYKKNIYQSSDGFIGSAKQLAEHLNAHESQIYSAKLYGWKVKGQSIALIKNRHSHKNLKVYKDGELVFIGNPKQIANKFYVSESAVYGAIYRKGKLLREFVLEEKNNDNE